MRACGSYCALVVTGRFQEKVLPLSNPRWPGRLWRMSIDWPLSDQYDEDAAEHFVWTSPEALRCGDRLVLYEGGRGNRSAFVAIGRAVTDAVRAHRGDRRHWAWVQWLPLAVAQPLAAVRDSTGYAHVSGSHVSVDEARYRLWSYLIRDDAARLVVDTWRRGEDFPTTDEVPIHQLFDAKWRYRPRHEVSMYEKIEDALIAEGCSRAPEDLSLLLRAMRGWTPTQPDVERSRQPDIWVLRGGRSKTLLMVEVKRRARHLPASDYDAVAQVCNYVDVAKHVLRGTAFGNLAIRPMVVAYVIDSDERAHARAAGVECRLLTSRTHQLRPVA